MTITVKVGEAQTRLSELLAKVEAGEDVIIGRRNEPIARPTRIHRRSDIEAAIEEIRAWRDDGHRF